MNFKDFRLQIMGGPEKGYAVNVQSPSGETTARFDHESLPTGEDLLGTILVRLVVLNSCESASAPGDAARWDLFSGVAITLVLGGVPAVVAMQYAISDKAAIEFSRTFYQRIADGDFVDAAVTEGRQAIHSRNSAGTEWAIPVLFMRTPTGELFPQKKIRPKRRTRERLATSKEVGGVRPAPVRRTWHAQPSMLHEVKINFVGRWKGSWENIVKPDKGEEIIEVTRQRGGKIWGHFSDLAEPFIIDFEGEFRYGTLFAKYWARKGEPILQQGSCCLRLKDNRTLEGYYADFSGCGFYKLKLMDRLSPARSRRAQAQRKN